MQSDIRRHTLLCDHLLILITMNHFQDPATVTYRRNWLNYTKESLVIKLSNQNWKIVNDNVQGYWNSFVSKLVAIIDELAQ